MRLFLLWFLMLALPLQGMAAVSMLHCGTDMQHSQRTVHMPLDTQPHHHASTAQTHDDGANAHASANATPLPDTNHKCSLCAFCCTFVAMAEAPAPLLWAQQPAQHSAEPPSPLDTLALRVPEKPPRA